MSRGADSAPVLPDARNSRSGGRPRSETTRKAILAATLKLLQHESVQAVTIEAIAREAGVSKATIYRWWQSKASVVIDAFVENHIVRTPMRSDIHPAEALLSHWRLFATQYSGWAGRIVGQILAEGQSDAETQREFRERFYYGRRAVVLEVFNDLRKAVPSVAKMDGEMFLDLLYSPVYMRLFWGFAPIDEKFIEHYPIEVFRLVGIEFDKEGRFISRR